jgi:hypothetical protein
VQLRPARAADELDDLVGAGAGGEDFGDAEALQLRDVFGGDRAADGVSAICSGVWCRPV